MDRAAEHGVAADGRRSDPEQAAAERQDISRTIDTMVVIDASVLTDIFLANRPRHESAKKLWEKIRASRTTVRIPMHGLFELSTAMKREGIKKPQDFEFNRAISEEDPLTLE